MPAQAVAARPPGRAARHRRRGPVMAKIGYARVSTRTTVYDYLKKED
jgi:hypothetical protein